MLWFRNSFLNRVIGAWFCGLVVNGALEIPGGCLSIMNTRRARFDYVTLRVWLLLRVITQ